MLVEVLNRGASPCATLWHKDTQWSTLLKLLQSTFQHRTRQPPSSSSSSVDEPVSGTIIATAAATTTASTHAWSAYFSRNAPESIPVTVPTGPALPLSPLEHPPAPSGSAARACYFPTDAAAAHQAHEVEPTMDPLECAAMWDSVLALPAHLRCRELLAIITAACCRWLPQERPTLRCVASVLRSFLPFEPTPATGEFGDRVVPHRLHVFHRRDLWLASHLLDRYQHVTMLQIECELLECDADRLARAMRAASRLERVWVPKGMTEGLLRHLAARLSTQHGPPWRYWRSGVAPPLAVFAVGLGQAPPPPPPTHTHTHTRARAHSWIIRSFVIHSFSQRMGSCRLFIDGFVLYSSVDAMLL
jgi:hypothetical protein